jgi:signal transduction histidine kinase/ActR/RegA family two-component response regulator
MACKKKQVRSMPPAQSMPPFGLSAVIPSFDRATRLAKALFQALESSIVLVEESRKWRSRDPEERWPSQNTVAVDHVMKTGELLWLEDATCDPRFDPNDFIAGDHTTRFCAAAPVRLSDGSTPGVLIVIDAKTRPFDKSLANRLTDLADSVADECDRAQAAERIERSGQRLQLALELADVSVTDLDYERRTVEIAGAAGPMLRETRTFEEMTTGVLSLVDPRDRERVGQALRAFTKEGTPFNPEYRIHCSDGREIWSRSAVRIFKDKAGKITRYVSAAQNITDRKLAEFALIQAKEEAEAANRAKSTFLATMSHEIRTPLNGVLGMAQAMAMGDLQPEQRSQLDVIRRSGETLLRILNDVLDLSKIEAGKLELENIAFDIGELVRGVRDIFAPNAQAKGCDFVLSLEPAAAGVYRGDLTRVRQILYNLVSNALKFTETGEVRLAVRAAPRGLELVVKDSGIGISPEHMGALFRKFEQADASTTRRFGGTGLGLAICQELATLMGGSISVESVQGQGAAFTVILPLSRVGDTLRPKAEEAAPSVAPAPSGAAMRVLAAEDNEVNQQVLKALLQQVGAELRVVEDGLEAVAAWEAEDWDVILMDVHMPKMDGLAATRIIRQREQEAGRSRIPIIALTANAMAHQVAEYVAAGMDDFVAKPVVVGQLFAALDAALAADPAPADRAVG